ncbi:hypothetical protein D9613_005915 [Agrocybe pediades]|uniref:Glycosyltransferase family 28 N-terminal domain-containing protein n=1 Tax=Agrocybe pediades TaxID=84607 RepID=A0A8H4VPH7_9AGAR|nr:hypothetical protein D9613_005915 [Agrocybe pediades]
MMPTLSRILTRPGSKTSKPTRSSTGSSLFSTDSGSLNNSEPKPSPSEILHDASSYEEILCRSGCIKDNKTSGGSEIGLTDLVAEEINTKASNTSEEIQENDFASHSNPIIHRASTSDSSTISLYILEFQDIIDILVQEFGSLVGPDEEEKLLLETDGCLVQHVAIVGVIHLTTHRLTFHASLLPQEPETSSLGAIKTGPAIMHRTGWRAKRRVWIELSRDVICIYSSSRDEDKVKPISALPLSFISGIVPCERSKGRVVQLSLSASAKTYNDYAEFDTEESASDWRQALTGALFNYRHLRKKDDPAAVTEASGIRMCFPLFVIKEVRPADSLEFCSDSLRTIYISPSKPVEAGQNEPRIFTLGPFVPVQQWNCLWKTVLAAKEQYFSPDSKIFAQTVIDYGPYDFEADRIAPSSQDGPFSISLEEETDVRYALGIDPTSQLWIVRARTCGHIWGRFAVGERLLGFWNKNTTHKDVHYRLPVDSIHYARPFSAKWINVNGLKVGSSDDKPELRFIFKSASVRDEAIRRIEELVNKHWLSTMGATGETGKSSPTTAIFTASPEALDANGSELTPGNTELVLEPKSPVQDPVSVFSPISRTLAAATAAGSSLSHFNRWHVPTIINVPRNILITCQTMHFVCLSIGSRGDVQPYIALGLGLKKEGHKVTIVTHEEYKDWILGFGLEHRQAGGDPGALMKLSVENKMFSPEFVKQSLTKFRPWLDQLLADSWEACQDADVLLESPSAMAGVHIAEGLNIPYFRAFTMPWTKTSAFPHAFLSPPVDAPAFNSASYVLFNNVMWAATSKQINKWRRQRLGLKNTDMAQLAQSKIVFIYNFSKAVVPKPIDWPDTTIISGYWFLDNPELDWSPPQELVDWMAKAREDGKSIVYIGFGSITIPHPNKVTSRIIEAVLQSDVRAIVTKGWSGRMGKRSGDTSPPTIPPECFLWIKSLTIGSSLVLM